MNSQTLSEVGQLGLVWCVATIKPFLAAVFPNGFLGQWVAVMPGDYVPMKMRNCIAKQFVVEFAWLKRLVNRLGRARHVVHEF